MASVAFTVNGKTSTLELDADIAAAAAAFCETVQAGRPDQVLDGEKYVPNTCTGQEWAVKQLVDMLFNYAASAESVAREAKRPSVLTVKTVDAG
jgi:uncharacterized protein (DUF2252 family)